MLLQDWFTNEKFLMVYDCYGVQVFFDKVSRAFYEIEEDSHENLTIVEVQPGSRDYAYYMSEYAADIVNALLG